MDFDTTLLNRKALTTWRNIKQFKWPMEILARDGEKYFNMYINFYVQSYNKISNWEW